MKARIRWTGDMSFTGVADSGHEVLIDGPPELGGRNRGSRPMELVLIGMGGCTAADVVHILRKARQAIDDCAVEVSAERASNDPKVFTRIHVHFVLRGKERDSQKVAHAVELSATKYCSASIMLGKTASITHDFEILGSG